MVSTRYKRKSIRLSWPARNRIINRISNSKLPNYRDIRVLDPHQGENLSGDLKCTIRRVALDTDISYEALSYTWGDASQQSAIGCKGARLAITKPLETALRYLRSTKSNLTLWVDAVCIDQKNLEERNQQVLLMRVIYSPARKVVAWIGEERGLDTVAMDNDNYSIHPLTYTEGKEETSKIF